METVDDGRRFRRSLLGVLVLVAVVASLGEVLTLRAWRHATNEREQILMRDFEGLLEAERLRTSIEETVASGRGRLLSDEYFGSRLRKSRAALERGIARVSTDAGGRPSALRRARFESAALAYLATLDGLVDARAQGIPREELLRRFEAELIPKRRDLDDAVARILAEKRAQLREGSERARSVADAAARISIGGLLVAVAASLIAGWFAGRRLIALYLREQDALHAARNAIAARQELLAVVAHDLRTPLGTVLLKAGILERAADSESLKRHAASIERVAQRMGNLLNTLLDAESIETGKFSILARKHPVHHLLHEVADTFSEQADSSGVRIFVSVEPDLECHFDYDRMLQVLSNLVGNALRFTPAGGHVVLRAQGWDGGLRIVVADTGSGIDPAHREHVFERFWKLGKGGTGLGLFIAKGIVEAHGGEIELESVSGAGTAFRITLPLGVPAPLEESVRSESAPTH